MKLDRASMRALAMVSGIGFSLAAAILIGLVVGHWLDTRFHTPGIFLIAGILLGLLTAGTMLYQLTDLFTAGADNRPKDEPHGRG